MFIMCFLPGAVLPDILVCWLRLPDRANANTTAPVPAGAVSMEQATPPRQAPHLQQHCLHSCEAGANPEVNLLPCIHRCSVCCIRRHQLLHCPLQLARYECTEACTHDAHVSVGSCAHLNHLWQCKTVTEDHHATALKSRFRGCKGLTSCSPALTLLQPNFLYCHGSTKEPAAVSTLCFGADAALLPRS